MTPRILAGKWPDFGRIFGSVESRWLRVERACDVGRIASGYESHFGLGILDFGLASRDRGSGGTGLYLIPSAFWIIIFTERPRLRCPSEKGTFGGFASRSSALQ